MIALAWPFVALVAIGAAAWLVRSVTEDLLKQDELVMDALDDIEANLQGVRTDLESRTVKLTTDIDELKASHVTTFERVKRVEAKVPLNGAVVRR